MQLGLNLAPCSLCSLYSPFPAFFWTEYALEFHFTFYCWHISLTFSFVILVAVLEFVLYIFNLTQFTFKRSYTPSQIVQELHCFCFGSGGDGTQGLTYAT
jgi:hypothetical protein